MRRPQLFLQTIATHTRTLTSNPTRLSSTTLPGTLAHPVPNMAPLNPTSLVCATSAMSVPASRVQKLRAALYKQSDTYLGLRLGGSIVSYFRFLLFSDVSLSVFLRVLWMCSMI